MSLVVSLTLRPPGRRSFVARGHQAGRGAAVSSERPVGWVRNARPCHVVCVVTRRLSSRDQTPGAVPDEQCAAVGCRCGGTPVLLRLTVCV